MKLLIKNLETNNIVFQGEITSKTDYQVIEERFPQDKYSREGLKI